MGRKTSLSLVQIMTWRRAGPVPSHYLNQRWHIANWTHVNNSQRNFNQNFKLLHWKKLFENVVSKIAAIMFRPQYVKTYPRKYFYGLIVVVVLWIYFQFWSIHVMYLSISSMFTRWLLQCQEKNPEEYGKIGSYTVATRTATSKVVDYSQIWQNEKTRSAYPVTIGQLCYNGLHYSEIIVKYVSTVR